LVSKPANPRSVILEGNEFFDESKAEILTVSSIKENVMSDNYEKQVAELQKELSEAKAANEVLKDKVVAEQHAEFSEKIQNLEATIADQATKLAEQEEANKTLAESLKSQEEALAAKDEEFNNQEKELATMKQKEAMMQRKAKLEDIGLESDEAAATVEEFKSVDDDTFDKIVAVMVTKEAYSRMATKEKRRKRRREGRSRYEEKAELDEEMDDAEAEC
jgi:chromosome segregation ATPase